MSQWANEPIARSPHWLIGPLSHCLIVPLSHYPIIHLDLPHTIPSIRKQFIFTCIHCGRSERLPGFFVENERSARRFLKSIWKEMVIDEYEWLVADKESIKDPGIISPSGKK